MHDARTQLSRHAVLGPFDLSRAPVTQAELGTGSESSQPDVPAHPVTWFEAVRWCNALSVDCGLMPVYRIVGRHVEWRVEADGFRLPTEAEWEWGCRAGTVTPTYGPLEKVA